MVNDKIIVFDGECNFCNAAVQFIIRRDRQCNFKFATFQSRATHNLLMEYDVYIEKPESIALLNNRKLFLKSDAAIQILRELDAFGKVFVVFSIIPKFIRDYLYTLFAKHRYKWFGKMDECFIPSPELRQRFLN